MRKTSIALRFAASLVLIAYPFYGMADQSDAVTSEPSTLPKIKTSKGLYYPDRAKLLGQEGKVIVAFDIAENGQATNSSLVFSDNNLEPLFRPDLHLERHNRRALDARCSTIDRPLQVWRIAVALHAYF